MLLLLSPGTDTVTLNWAAVGIWPVSFPTFMYYKRDIMERSLGADSSINPPPLTPQCSHMHFKRRFVNFNLKMINPTMSLRHMSSTVYLFGIAPFVEPRSNKTFSVIPSLRWKQEKPPLKGSKSTWVSFRVVLDDWNRVRSCETYLCLLTLLLMGDNGAEPN